MKMSKTQWTPPKLISAVVWFGLLFVFVQWWELGLGVPMGWTSTFLAALAIQEKLTNSSTSEAAQPKSRNLLWWIAVVLTLWLIKLLRSWGALGGFGDEVRLLLGLADFVLPLALAVGALKRFALSSHKWLAYVAVATSLVFLIWFVSVRMPGSSYSGPQAPLHATEVETQVRLEAHVEHLATTIGARSVRERDGLLAARDYIVASLVADGWTPTLQEFEADGEIFWNVEVAVPGDGSTDELVLVGAHYDVCGSRPGADDNGSGVAALLEMAHFAKHANAKRGLRLVFFANEEPPHFGTENMGSRVRARAMTAAQEKVSAMFSLESIGYFRDEPGSQQYPFPLGFFYPSQGDFIAFVGNPNSRQLVRDSIASFRKSTYFPSQGSVSPSFVPGVYWSDHASFWKEGTEAIMITDTAPFRNPNYHRATDTPDTLDFPKLARLVPGLWQVVLSAAND